MSPPVDIRDPAGPTASRGRSYLYVLPCAFEDLLKLGFSRDPLDRAQSLHRRWFEFFDPDRALLVETETVRDARALELALRRELAEHNAPAPLTVRTEAAGHTEWYRGAYAHLGTAVRALAELGHVVHAPARPWLRAALTRRGDLLYAWTLAMLDVDELDSAALATPRARAVRDALDAFRAMELDVEPLLAPAVLDWYRRLG